MSYEGYMQAICKNGHYSERDVCDLIDACDCGVPFAWANDVDQTNGPSQGEIPMDRLEKFVVKPEFSEVCNLGHRHVIERAVFLIPTKAETDPLRVYRDEDSGELLERS